jgi:hypothetical protein
MNFRGEVFDRGIVFCCAQQTGMHILGCGSTAYCYLPRGKGRLYTHSTCLAALLPEATSLPKATSFSWGLPS